MAEQQFTLINDRDLPTLGVADETPVAGVGFRSKAKGILLNGPEIAWLLSVVDYDRPDPGILHIPMTAPVDLAGALVAAITVFAELHGLANALQAAVEKDMAAMRAAAQDHPQDAP